MIIARLLAFGAAVAFFWTGVFFARVLFEDQAKRELSWLVTLTAIVLCLGAFGSGMIALYCMLWPRVLL